MDRKYDRKSKNGRAAVIELSEGFLSMEKEQKHKPIVFEDESFDFQLVRHLSYSVAQMADINECLMTANQIQNGNFESWYNAWYKTAQRVHAIGEESLKNGHMVSAQSAFLRASNYYLASDSYLHGNPADPRIRDASHKSIACFMKAIALTSTSIIPVKIPYEGTTLPGYFYTVDGKKRATILMQAGFDGTQEELFARAMEAIKRGYNVLTFEGPGQGAVLREQGLFFRPDWEIVIRSVVDFAITQKEVDASMLILYGESFGGYFAPRGASGDDRIKILITNGGFYDLVAAMAAIEGNTKDTLVKEAKTNADAFDLAIRQIMKVRTSIRWFFERGMFSFGAKTPSELILKCAEYTLINRAQLIKSTTLVVDADNEMPLFRGQGKRIYDHLTCPKTYMLFTAKEAAGLHCQLGSLLLSTQRIYDWVDETVTDLKKHTF